MKIIDKTLAPYQQKLADAMEDLVQMVAQTYDGFMKHKKPPLAEAEKIGKRIHDFERDFAQALCKEGDKVGAVTLLSLAGHVERIGGSLEGVIGTVHTKIKEGTLFSEKAVSELTYVYNTVKDMARNTKDVILTLNSFLADYVKAEGEKLSERAMEFTTAHEERMISGVCQPVHSAMYQPSRDSVVHYEVARFVFFFINDAGINGRNLRGSAGKVDKSAVSNHKLAQESAALGIPEGNKVGMLQGGARFESQDGSAHHRTHEGLNFALEKLWVCGHVEHDRSDKPVYADLFREGRLDLGFEFIQKTLHIRRR